MNNYFLELKKYPPLSCEEERSVFAIYYADDSTKKEKEDAREKIINSNLRFVVKKAKSFGSTTDSISELISAGNVGLIYSFNQFDPSLGFRFLTFASWWICHYIRLELHNSKLVKIPTWKVKAFSKLAKTREAFLAKGDLTPSLEDMAAHSGMDEPLINKLMGEDSTLVTLSTGLNEFPIHNVKVCEPHSIYEEEDKKFFCKHLDKSLKDLSPIDRIIIKYYHKFCKSGLQYTLQHLSEVLGVSAERVRQRKNDSLIKIRRYFKREVHIDDLPF